MFIYNINIVLYRRPECEEATVAGTPPLPPAGRNLQQAPHAFPLMAVPVEEEEQVRDDRLAVSRLQQVAFHNSISILQMQAYFSPLSIS